MRDIAIRLNKISDNINEEIKSIKSNWKDEAALEFVSKLSDLCQEIQLLSQDISK